MRRGRNASFYSFLGVILMGKLQDDNRIDRTLKEVIQMPTQADSAAADVATLKTDFNALLAKLKTAGLMK